MKVPNLGSRVFEIYFFTSVIGSVVISFFIALFSFNLMLFFAATIVSFLASLILCIPNIIILNLGIKQVYKDRANKKDLDARYLYLWLANISFTTLGAIAFISLDSYNRFDIETFLGLLLGLSPYMIASLYYIFKVNRKYDKIKAPFQEIEDMDDILDMNL